MIFEDFCKTNLRTVYPYLTSKIMENDRNTPNLNSFIRKTSQLTKYKYLRHTTLYLHLIN